MFFRILKKDLKRKKSMNIILLIFIILATMFLASSVNNMMVVSKSIDYFMDKAKTPDYIISTYGNGENAQIDDWLSKSKFVKAYEVDRNIIITKDEIKIKRGSSIVDFEPSGTCMLTKQPKKYGKLLDENGDEAKLVTGEIALSLADKNKNNLQVGDRLIISLGNIKREFKVKGFIKDAIFGSSMNEMKRMLISDGDYNTLKNYNMEGSLSNYYIMSPNTSELSKEFKHIDSRTIIDFDKSLLNTTFILDMIPAGVLIIVSICLILIAFLILRFTIIFTLQDDYKEIGIMKAIGLKDFDIKKVYLIKYFAITFIGAVLGFAASFSFGNIFLNQSKGNILMEPSTGNIIVNILCAIFIVLIVLLFCYTSTRKLNKFSAIDAIRNGSNGESFKSKSRLKLRNANKLKVPVFIAINDILCNVRRFSVLILTFCIGTVLIIVPLNSINTFKDGDIVKLFGINHSDVYIQTDNMDRYAMGGNKATYLADLHKLETSINDKGIKLKLYGEVMYRLKFYAGDMNNSIRLLTLQYLNTDNDRLDVLKGSLPVLENEIAITEKAAKKLNVSIGDTMVAQIGNQKKEFIITGLYESMTNMGESVRVSKKMNIDFKYLASINPFQGNFIGNGNKEEQIDRLKNQYPKYTIQNAQQFVSKYIGGSMAQLDAMKNLIVILVIGINTLITVLMIKTFIAREKGEIAMLKSVGFRNSSIRIWQATRIFIVLVVAIVLAIILSKFVGPLTIGQVFAMMGVKNISLKVNPAEVYLLYPVLLLTVTTAVAYLSAGAVKKVDLKEINDME